MPEPTPQADPASKLIVALDLPGRAEALAFVARLDGRARWFKVGLELYLAAGPAIVSDLRDRGFSVFLDLKLHDIPNTVAAAVHSLRHSGAALLTVHALGGSVMLRAANEASMRSPHGPRLVAVTVLTSMDEAALGEIGIAQAPREQVLRLARLARAAGIPRLVCSAEELEPLRQESPEAPPLLVVPGIRPAGGKPDDQRRTATPAAALAAGASMLVVGRPITAAVDPAVALDSILSEIAAAAS